MKKRIGWIVVVLGTVIGVVSNINDAYQFVNAGLPTQVYTAVGFVLVLIGFIAVMTYKEDNKVIVNGNRTVSSPSPKKSFTLNEVMALGNLKSQMQKVHGKSDDVGIDTDYRNNVDINDILKRDCTECGMPRNEIGRCYLM